MSSDGGRGREEVRLPAPPRPKDIFGGWEGLGSTRAKGVVGVDIVAVVGVVSAVWWWWWWWLWRRGTLKLEGRLERYSKTSASLMEVVVVREMGGFLCDVWVGVFD